MSTQMLSEVETAARLRCSPKTLRNWRAKCCGPKYVKYRGVILYPESGLQDFFASHTIDPALRTARRRARKGVSDV